MSSRLEPAPDLFRGAGITLHVLKAMPQQVRHDSTKDIPFTLSFQAVIPDSVPGSPFGITFRVPLHVSYFTSILPFCAKPFPCTFTMYCPTAIPLKSMLALAPLTARLIT